MTGERGSIPEDVLVAMREAGLAQLLAISGPHVGLVAGILLFSLRLGFASAGGLALRYPAKKWAAAIALISSMNTLWHPAKHYGTPVGLLLNYRHYDQ